MSGLVEALLRAGASYFVCWGADCERVHDIVGEIASDPDNDYGVPEEACIMTTWHDSEPLAGAIDYLLVCSQPAEAYRITTHAALAISIGSSAWAAEIADAFDRPREFIGRWIEGG